MYNFFQKYSLTRGLKLKFLAGAIFLGALAFGGLFSTKFIGSEKEYLCDDYYTDQNYVYYKINPFYKKKIKTSDPNTFDCIIAGFAKDQYSVYFKGKILEGEDPKYFDESAVEELGYGDFKGNVQDSFSGCGEKYKGHEFYSSGDEEINIYSKSQDRNIKYEFAIIVEKNRNKFDCNPGEYIFVVDTTADTRYFNTDVWNGNNLEKSREVACRYINSLEKFSGANTHYEDIVKKEGNGPVARFDFPEDSDFYNSGIPENSDRDQDDNYENGWYRAPYWSSNFHELVCTIEYDNGTFSIDRSQDIKSCLNPPIHNWIAGCSDETSDLNYLTFVGSLVEVDKGFPLSYYREFYNDLEKNCPIVGENTITKFKPKEDTWLMGVLIEGDDGVEEERSSWIYTDLGTDIIYKYWSDVDFINSDVWTTDEDGIYTYEAELFVQHDYSCKICWFEDCTGDECVCENEEIRERTFKKEVDPVSKKLLVFEPCVPVASFFNFGDHPLVTPIGSLVFHNLMSEIHGEEHFTVFDTSKKIFQITVDDKKGYRKNVMYSIDDFGKLGGMDLLPKNLEEGDKYYFMVEFTYSSFVENFGSDAYGSENSSPDLIPGCKFEDFNENAEYIDYSYLYKNSI